MALNFISVLDHENNSHNVANVVFSMKVTTWLWLMNHEAIDMLWGRI